MMLRRHFLAAPAAALQSGRRLRSAFLGASHSHAPEKLRLVRASSDYDLAGVWEDNPQARAALPNPSHLRWLTKAQILADKSIEVVFIQGGVKSHGPLAIEALEAGKHCHIEKPAAENLRDMRRIVDLAKSRNLVIQSGYMWRHNPAVERALEAARNGWLGDVYSIHARMNTLIGLDRRPEWDLFPGGQMFEQGAHLVDIVVRLLGRPQRITPFLRHDGNFADTLKDNTAAVLEYPRAMAILVSSVLQPNANAHRALEIFGASGNAVIRPIEPPSLEIDLVTPAGPYAKGKQKVTLPPYERYVGDIAALAKAIRGEKPLDATPDTELAVTEVLLTASQMVK
jgi:predicted dehydrogenase